MTKDAVDIALAYHERTKHRLPNRYAASLRFLDWATQPDPFRLYAGAPKIALRRDDDDGADAIDDVYDPSRVHAARVDRDAIARVLYDALALSAWKQQGSSRWSLRCNPSSGNLHPTEAYLVTPALDSNGAPLLAHYSPLLHALEVRASLPDATFAGLVGDGDGFVVVMTSIPWREAWKYGERAFRYCQHDIGHAIGALAFAAAARGWHVRMLGEIDDGAALGLLGLPDPVGPEAEYPEVALFVGPRPPSSPVTVADAPDVTGEPNALSEAHQRWPVIEQVARACVRDGPRQLEPPALHCGGLPDRTGAPARFVFRTRRSAVAMDGETSISRAAWLRMLARLMPRAGHVPFAALPGRARVHALMFVHRVDDVEPGIYMLLRDARQRDAVAKQMDAGLEWQRVQTDALDLPLFRLAREDTQRASAIVSCHQDIAADGAFAIAMLAELEPTLREHGASMYRHLHWEAGAMGHVLYLEAEAAGVRATGIGCFFDDAVHHMLSISDASLQTIYHFTVGGAVDDARLRTLDAYHHLDRTRRP